ncbi:hypothetical protein JTB14_009369 [Gonioctena quinquepunctata]|nr:hypothetical protein JTB14_009369 [Gonioctena quinquepunctata]
MAVTVLFNKNYRLFLLTQFSDDHCVCVELQTSIGKFIIVNIYHQFNEDIEAYVTKMRRIFLAYRNDPVIIAMDANAKSVLWHSGITDAKGEKIEDLINELQLEVHNRAGNPPTFQNRAGAESNIDITISNAKAANQIMDWKVEGNQTMSDHNLISLVIQKSELTGPRKKMHREGKYRDRKEGMYMNMPSA